MSVFYNEWDKFAAQWLRNLCARGELPAGTVDDRSITELRAGDLVRYRQCHFFAGIGGWPLALRLAGWPDDRKVWTASLPCQPFSSAGKRRGTADERHLWPVFARLVAECRPPAIFGEQVASGDGRAWLSGVRSDLEAMGYQVGAADLCAASIGAPHIRQRLYWVAYSDKNGFRGREESDQRQERSEQQAPRRGDIDGCSNISDGVGEPEGIGRPRWQDNSNEGRRQRAPGRAGSTRERERETAGWATPAATTWGGTAEAHLNRKRKAIAEGKKMGLVVSCLDQQATMAEASGPTPTSSPAPTAQNGALDAAFSRWLQGYPSAWDEASPNYSDWLAAQEATASGASKGTETPSARHSPQSSSELPKKQKRVWP